MPATVARPASPENRSTAKRCAGSSVIRTRELLGFGSVSRVYLAGMKNCTRHSPSLPADWATGAVMAIVSGRTAACATGEVMAMLARPWLAPKM